MEHRGLDRCPDRRILNHKRYTSLAVRTYNLKKIGREILRQRRAASVEAKESLVLAA